MLVNVFSNVFSFAQLLMNNKVWNFIFSRIKTVFLKQDHTYNSKKPIAAVYHILQE